MAKVAKDVSEKFKIKLNDEEKKLWKDLPFLTPAWVELVIEVKYNENTDSYYLDFKNRQDLIKFKSLVSDRISKCSTSVYNKNCRWLAKELELPEMTNKCREEVAIATKQLTKINKEYEKRLNNVEQENNHYKDRLNNVEKQNEQLINVLKNMGVNLDDLVKEQNISNDNDMEID